MSRPSLRQALDKLQAKGLIKTTKVGTVIAQFLSPLSKPLAELFAGKPRVTADYFEYRRIIDGQAASLAATRATDTDRAALKECCERIRKAHEIDDPSEEAAADADLHLLIYELAHNVVLLHVMRVFSELLRNDVLYNRNQLYQRYGVRDPLLKQHLAIGRSGTARRPQGGGESRLGSHQFHFSDDRRYPPRRGPHRSLSAAHFALRSAGRVIRGGSRGRTHPENIVNRRRGLRCFVFLKVMRPCLLSETP